MEEAAIAELARFAADLSVSDIPAEMIEIAKDHILDTIGVSLACARLPYAEIVERHASSPDRTRSARVLGSSKGYGPQVAALLNGSLSHGNDYDDSLLSGGVHPSGVVLAATLALFDDEVSDGSTLLAAFIAGVEVFSRVSTPLGWPLTHRGIHPTSACGAIAATAAAGRISGLDSAALARAMSLSVGTAGGIHQSTMDGTWNKRIHAGLAARAGVACCQLARAGAASPTLSFQRGNGLLRTFGLDDVELHGITAGLGKTWAASKLAIKQYPACQAVQSSVDCAIDLHRHAGIDLDRVESVKIWIPPIGVKLCEPFEERANPPNGLAGKYSLPFTVAYALARGSLTEAAFTSRDLVDPLVLQLAGRVCWTVDPAYDSEEAPGRVEVTTTDGRTIEARVDACRGTWQNPLGKSDVQAKFIANVQPLLAGPLEPVIAMVENLAGLDGMDQLFDACIIDRRGRRQAAGSRSAVVAGQ